MWLMHGTSLYNIKICGTRGNISCHSREHEIFHTRILHKVWTKIRRQTMESNNTQYCLQWKVTILNFESSMGINNTQFCVRPACNPINITGRWSI